MNKRKWQGETKLVAYTSLLTMVVMLSACGGGSGSSDTDEEGGESPSPTTDTGETTQVDVAQVDCPLTPELVDTIAADTIVGDGTAASCTEVALQNALSSGGVIRFDCGTGDHLISVTGELLVDQTTVLDGEGKITLDGGNSTRIMALRSSFEQTTPALTVQRLAFRNGVSTDTGEDTTSGGAAIYRVGGALTVLDSQFTNNRAAASGQDIAGGAIYSLGGGKTVISGSSLIGNSASNGGAIGNLHNDLTIINSTLDSNAATGSGGNPGNGGNGGGIYIDGNSQTVTMCGMTLNNNDANAFGGGLFRVSNNNVGSHSIDRSTIDGNQIPNNGSVSMAGGLYLQGVDIAITNSTISRNEAGHSGGFFVGSGSTLNMLNSTIAENESLDSLGGGISISDGVTGLIKNVTLANNRSTDTDSFAAATVGGSSVTMQNTIVDGHVAGNGFNAISCRDQFIEGSGNLQFPVIRSGAGSDDPSSLCTNNTLVADSQLGALIDNGGDTQTLIPAAGSPAMAYASDCPATDQRGEARSEPCTAGAVEVGL